MEDSVFFSNCLMSPSCCIPKHEEYARLPPPVAVCGGDRGGRSNRSRRMWRKLLRRLLREGNKCIYGSSSGSHIHKPGALTFQYDAVSYSQNFDEGCHSEENYHHLRRFSSPVIFPDHVR